MVKFPKITVKPAKKQLINSRKKYWDNLSPEERKEEVKKYPVLFTKEKWKSMSKKETEEFLTRRTKALREYWANLSPEKRAIRVERFKKVQRAFMKTPEGKKVSIANLPNNKVIRDLPRINDYAGVITMSEMEETLK